MLNIIWPIFLIISFVYAILTGRLEQVNASIFEGTKSAVELFVTLLGTMCLWNGIMKIAEKTSIMNKLKKTLKPILKVLFPKIKENDEEYTEISMNMIANIMGLRQCGNTNGLKGNEITTEKE